MRRPFAHRDVVKDLAYAGFFGGHIVVAAGLYVLLRGWGDVEGAVTFGVGLASTLPSAWKLIRTDK